MNNYLEGKKVKCKNTNGETIIGKVLLVYNEAMASGNNEYVIVTHVLVGSDNSSTHVTKPRDIIEVYGVC